MKFNIVLTLAICASQLLLAGETHAAAAQPDKSAKAAAPVPAASAAALARKRAAAIKPVDINSASKAELLKLPGLNAADADRIIAGRPYLSKANLVTHKIISEAQYQDLKLVIWARQKGTPKPMAAGGKKQAKP